MARQAARSLLRPVTVSLPTQPTSVRWYAPALEPQQPVASTSQAFIGSERSLKPDLSSQRSSASRAKGKAKAFDTAEASTREARATDAVSEARSETAEDVAASSDADRDLSGARQPSVGFGVSDAAFPTARYPESDVLGMAPVDRSLQLGALRHPINTHIFVENLVETGVPRERAEILMDAARILTLREIDRAQEMLVSKVAAENDAYLYSAALSELRTEIQVDVREETLAQRSANARIHRRIESLSQTTSEQVEGLKSEIKYEFQHARDETNADFKNMELRLQDVTNRIGLMFGRERAELESLKWILLRNIFLSVTGFALAAVIINEVSRERPQLPTVEAFGIKPLEDPESELVDSVPVRRVGEEEEAM